MLLAVLLSLLLTLLAASSSITTLALPAATTSPSCSVAASATACAALPQCLWINGCCHSSTVCTQDVASLQCSTGCSLCGNNGCFASSDTCPTPCEGLKDQTTCQAQAPSPTGTKCLWSNSQCITVAPLNGASAPIDPHFASAAAGIITRTQQAAMVSSAAQGNLPATANANFAAVPSQLVPGPADASSDGSKPATTAIFSPPSSSSSTDATNPNSNNNAWGSVFTLNGSHVTAPVIAGIIVGVVAVLGVAAVAVHRVVVKRRVLAAVSTPTASSVFAAAAAANAAEHGDESVVSVQHHRHSLLGWLQRVVQDVPPPTPLATTAPSRG